uniref:Putative secreted protein n=1 Tax=Anopheles darlingi TaxID=43151 RepID=A0A2M4CHQ3_ANODA
MSVWICCCCCCCCAELRFAAGRSNFVDTYRLLSPAIDTLHTSPARTTYRMRFYRLQTLQLLRPVWRSSRWIHRPRVRKSIPSKMTAFQVAPRPCLALELR